MYAKARRRDSRANQHLGDAWSIPSVATGIDTGSSLSIPDVAASSGITPLPPMPTYDFSSPVATALPGSGTATQTGNPAGNSWISNIASAFSQFGTAYANYRNQAQWNDLQLQRARQGLPPLPTTGYSAPGVGVNVGISPQVQQLLIIGGVGLGAVLLVNAFAGRRR